MKKDETMIPKTHIIGIRVNEEEHKRINNQVKKENLSYISALIRKATFGYIDYMDKQEEPTYEQESDT